MHESHNAIFGDLTQVSFGFISILGAHAQVSFGFISMFHDLCTDMYGDTCLSSFCFAISNMALWYGRTIHAKGVDLCGMKCDLGLKFIPSRKSAALGYWHCDVWLVSPCHSMVHFYERVFCCMIEKEADLQDGELVAKHRGVVWAFRVDDQPDRVYMYDMS